MPHTYVILSFVVSLVGECFSVEKLTNRWHVDTLYTYVQVSPPVKRNKNCTYDFNSHITNISECLVAKHLVNGDGKHRDETCLSLIVHNPSITCTVAKDYGLNTLLKGDPRMGHIPC